MKRIKLNVEHTKRLGYLGVICWIAVVLSSPGFLAPDLLIILLVFIFMSFGKAIEAIKRFGPFVLLLIVYGFFAGIADYLNSHINFMLAPTIDRAMFGGLPTVYLQNWLWHGVLRWYDYILFFPYMFHFVIPLVLGSLIWLFREKKYWVVMNSYLIAAYMAFLTYLLFPAAPPWMASALNYTEPIERIATDVVISLGFSGIPTVYGLVSSNPVAAVPSLHAAWATLLFITVLKCFGWRWSLLAAVYPILIFIGTVYTGEHYVFDLLLGALYGIIAYLISPAFTRWVSSIIKQAHKKSPILAHERKK